MDENSRAQSLPCDDCSGENQEALLLRIGELAREYRGREGSLIQVPVSYTHLDVYKRQEQPFVGDTLTANIKPSSATVTYSWRVGGAEAVSYTHLDVYKRQRPGW